MAARSALDQRSACPAHFAAAITRIRATIAATAGAPEVCGSDQAMQARDRCHRVLSAVRADRHGQLIGASAREPAGGAVRTILRRPLRVRSTDPPQGAAGGDSLQTPSNSSCTARLGLAEWIDARVLDDGRVHHRSESRNRPTCREFARRVRRSRGRVRAAQRGPRVAPRPVRAGRADRGGRERSRCGYC